MSLFGMMRTSTSGMAAQSSRLATVSDNIANASTHGYKRATTEFSTMVLESGGSNYTPGSVDVEVRYEISRQGSYDYTTSKTDLAISKNGFFIVEDSNGSTALTRAGSFVKNSDGELVNAAGYKLLGAEIVNGNATLNANGTAGLEVVNIATLALEATPTSSGTFAANLPVTADIVAAGSLPTDNVLGSTFSEKSSLVVIDNVGTEKTLDLYFTKTAANNWEVTIYDQSTKDTSATGPFPYSVAALVTTTLIFDPTTAKLDATSPTDITIPIPNGANAVIDLSAMSELDQEYATTAAEVDGNAPSSVTSVEFGADGTLYSVYGNGARVATYRIPLATVTSPDNLTPEAGNVYVLSSESGDLQVGFPGTGSLGTIKTSALEKSTVDTATELTNMIEAQYSYTANSKVFQTAGELMEVLVNLKR